MTCTSVQGRSQVAYVAMNKFQPYESPRSHWAPASTSMESLVLTRLIAAAGVDSVGLPGPTCQGGKISLVISRTIFQTKIHLMIMNDHWWFIFYVWWFSSILIRFVLYICIIRIGILRMFKKFLPAWRSWVHQLWVHLETTHSKPMASTWHRTILGAKVPTQLHSLEEVASFTKKKIVDFKLRWMTDGWQVDDRWMTDGWQDHWQWGNSGNTVPALQFWDVAKVLLVDLTWCQSLMKSAIFSRPKHRRFDGIRQHKMVSHQVHCKDLRVAEAQKEREDLMTSRAMEKQREQKNAKKNAFLKSSNFHASTAHLTWGFDLLCSRPFFAGCWRRASLHQRCDCDFH